MCRQEDRKVPRGGCRQQGIDAIGGPPPVPAAVALPDGGPKVPSDEPHEGGQRTLGGLHESQGVHLRHPMGGLHQSEVEIVGG
ncbi:hypothetical protein GCM10010394_55150 [Streptomyces crystallinus]|uniref:Uncharacterized protein n=1 Tax=Streptomyces crystallinus TaxID=68191 RepID=A0ABN1GS51_9ACTN